MIIPVLWPWWRLDPDASDFFFPNGGFNDKPFELLSYTTGNKSYSEFGCGCLTPASELPPSETQGVGILDVQGHCFGNLPPSPQGYIHRESLRRKSPTCSSRLNDIQSSLS